MKTKLRKNIKALSISIVFPLFILFLNPYPIQAQFLFEKIGDNGDDANRMVWVIMGDGYTSMEIDDYHQDVDRVIKEFFGTSPWSDYKYFINVYRIDVISNESGADHPSDNLYVDTALDSTYDTYGITRLLTVDDSKAFEIACIIPSFDAVMIIVNDESYGGSGGATMVLSNHEKAARIALHEAGHLVGGLADEYETPYPGYPEGDREPNVTYQKELEYIPWKNWIEIETPLPTPEFEGDFPVGLYEGARYKATDIYRPTHNSIMRSLGAPYGPINSESLIINLYDYVDPIDNYSPDKSNVFLSSNSNILQFKIELVPGPDENTQVGWEIDGVKQEGENNTSLNIDIATLKKGSHSIMVSVVENSSLVRNDPQGLLFSSHIWSLEKGLSSGVISGKVINAITNLGIEGALVETMAEIPDRTDDQVEESKYSTKTAADGSFSLSPVNEGVYTITANSERYSSNLKSNIIVNDGDTKTVALPLDPLFNTFTVSGNITGDGEEELTIYLNKEEDNFLSFKTNVNGNYIFNGLENGSYTLTPISSEYVFNPPFYEFSVEDKDLTGFDFKTFAIFCPAQAVLEQPSSLELLRKLRRNVLAKNETGRKYTNLYYKHGAELVSHIIAHQDVREDSATMLLEIMPDFRVLLQGKNVILNEELIDKVEDLLDTLESYASSDLGRTLNMIRKDIRDKSTLNKFGVIIQ